MALPAVLSDQVGRVAQLGERLVRNEEVAGSIPVSSTIFSTTYTALQNLPKLPNFASFGHMTDS